MQMKQDLLTCQWKFEVIQANVFAKVFSLIPDRIAYKSHNGRHTPSPRALPSALEFLVHSIA